LDGDLVNEEKKIYVCTVRPRRLIEGCTVTKAKGNEDREK
jgi:hypothetical protein